MNEDVVGLLIINEIIFLFKSNNTFLFYFSKIYVVIWLLRIFLSFNLACSSVWSKTPILTSISPISVFIFAIAFFIFTSGAEKSDKNYIFEQISFR